MALKPAIPKQFDDAKLAAMAEPFTVRVEKLKGGQRQPIPLPESEEVPGQGGGVGYGKEDVRGLEQFLVTEWSGGGYYDIKVTDAQGVVLHWTPTWDPQLYPEKIPAMLQGAFNPSIVPASSKRNSMAHAFPNGFPNFGQMQQPQQYGGYQQPNPYQQFQYPPMPPPPMVGTPQYAMWSHEAKERGESAEIRSLREENQRRERESIEARHKAEIERDRQATEARFNAQTNAMSELRTLITSLATTIQAGAQRGKPDDALEAMKLQLQQQTQQAEADRRDREIERRERETRDLIQGMQVASQKQIDAMMRQLDAFQASLTAVNANKQDPMIEMLKEQSRQSAEMVKTIATSHSSAIDKMQSNMMHPRDILAVAREASVQADQVTDKLTTSFGRVIDLQAKVTENALSLQPQGTPVVDMVRDGASHVKEMVERYFGRAELQTKLQAASQEQLLNAQRDIQIAQIQAASPGLAGMPQQQMQYEQQPQMTNGHINHQTPSKAKKVKIKPVLDALGQPIKPRKILGKTDEEWFGPILGEIQQLRAGVAKYCESILSKPPELDEHGAPVGVSSEQAGQFIAQGTAMVLQANVNIPAMALLLFEQRYAEFMEVVLPDAPEPFRVEVLQMLITTLRGSVGGPDTTETEPEPDAEDPPADGEDDKDDGDPDDDNDGDGDSDAEPDKGNDIVQEPDSKPDVAAKVVAVPMLRSIGPNGKPVNPPRRT